MKFKDRNREHPTFNVQHPTSNGRQMPIVGRGMLNVGCWMLTLVAPGCAGYVPALPQSQGQTADRNGPVIVHIYQGVQSFGHAGPPAAKLAETITVTVSAPATADGSVQGAATQSASQDGSQLGAVDQNATGELKLPLP
jgi:hypothetical protein